MAAPKPIPKPEKPKPVSPLVRKTMERLQSLKGKKQIIQRKKKARQTIIERLERKTAFPEEIRDVRSLFEQIERIRREREVASSEAGRRKLFHELDEKLTALEAFLESHGIDSKLAKLV